MRSLSSGLMVVSLLVFICLPSEIEADVKYTDYMNWSQEWPQNMINNSQTSEIVCFWSEGFPTIDAQPILKETLHSALEEMPITFVHRVFDLGFCLLNQKSKLLILPYGSAFPLDAWTAIERFLRRGGNLVILGGRPFSHPVHWNEDVVAGGVDDRRKSFWVTCSPTPAFAQKLLIGPAEKIYPDDTIGKLIPKTLTTGTALCRKIPLVTLPSLPGSAGPKPSRTRMAPTATGKRCCGRWFTWSTKNRTSLWPAPCSRSIACSDRKRADAGCWLRVTQNFRRSLSGPVSSGPGPAPPSWKSSR